MWDTPVAILFLFSTRRRQSPVSIWDAPLNSGAHFGRTGGHLSLHSGRTAGHPGIHLNGNSGVIKDAPLAILDFWCPFV